MDSKPHETILLVLEGAEARSLYFQFWDRPIKLEQEQNRLSDLGDKDPRYAPMSSEIDFMVNAS